MIECGAKDRRCTRMCIAVASFQRKQQCVHGPAGIIFEGFLRKVPEGMGLSWFWRSTVRCATTGPSWFTKLDTTPEAAFCRIGSSFSPSSVLSPASSKLLYRASPDNVPRDGLPGETNTCFPSQGVNQIFESNWPANKIEKVEVSTDTIGNATRDLGVWGCDYQEPMSR